MIASPVLAGEPDALRSLGVGGKLYGAASVASSAFGGQHRRDVGDGGVVAPGFVFRCVGDRWGQQTAERVDNLVVGVPGALKSAVGRLGLGGGVPWVSNTELVRVTAKVITSSHHRLQPPHW